MAADREDLREAAFCFVRECMEEEKKAVKDAAKDTFIRATFDGEDHRIGIEVRGSGLGVLSGWTAVHVSAVREMAKAMDEDPLDVARQIHHAAKKALREFSPE